MTEKIFYNVVKPDIVAEIVDQIIRQWLKEKADILRVKYISNLAPGQMKIHEILELKSEGRAYYKSREKLKEGE